MRVNILGVQIDKLTRQEVLKKIEEFLESGKPHYIVTANPEFVMAAQADEEFRQILNQASLTVPDGIGLVFASWFLGNPLKERVAGSDLIWDLAKIAEYKNCSMYLLGADEGVAKKAAKELKEKYLKLRVAGAESGGVWNYELGPTRFARQNQAAGIKNYEILKNINKVKPDILLVAFGQVKQEKWIAWHLKELPSVKIVIGVGGSFDFISGKVKRAPYILRRLGLEWLWRLMMEPKRARRIFTATFRFSWCVLKYKLKEQK